MKKFKKTLSAMLILAMVVGILPQMAFAADYVAYVEKADGTVTNYSSFAAAWNAAVAANNATVGLYTSYMHHAGENSYILPAGKTVTVELSGNVLLRNITTSRDDGSVFDVKKNATLTIYGGNKENPAYKADEEHNLPVYVANADRLGYTRRNETLYGGVIQGGNCNRGAGGIMMREGAKVYLYNVTVAGNKADDMGVASSYGDGGGIYMDGKYGYLHMEDSSICYNFAYNDGGGVLVHSDFCRIEMIRSHIAHNVADDNGGGIFVEGESFSLRGDAEQFMDPESVITNNGIKDWNGSYKYFMPDELGSSVSYNCVFDSEDGGGGIHMDSETGLISGVNIVGNIATNDDDKGDGGGIYLDEEEITVLNCNILRNKADKLGGGICVRGDNNIIDRDDNAIDNCTVYKNVAWASDGAGGGIYVYRYCDLGISGSMIVSGNVSQSYPNDNLYLSSDGGAVDAYLKPATTPGADVHIRLAIAGAKGHGTQISRDGGSYDISHFSYDNDTKHYIGWNRDWSDRHLKVVEGTKPARPAAETFTPDARARTQTVEGGYNGYPLIKGIFSYPSFPDDNADLENVFYYSDGFFAGNPNDYNEHLATASFSLAAASGYSNIPNADGKICEGNNLNDRNDYLDKSKNFRQFVSDIGCKDEDIFVNDFNLQKPGADTIGVGIASKPIFDGKTLVIIGVRGMGYESEWISNMTLGSTGEAQGWSSATGQVMAELKDYLKRNGIDGASEDTIFWIAGYSRAGATSNLTAKRIVDVYDNNGTHTFAYPLEAPMGGQASLKVEGNNYNCIHNIVNQNDIVPWVGTTEMGFIRYGVDHYVPGSPDTSEPKDGSDNNKIPEDNTAWDVEGNSYQSQRPKMIAQLKAVNPDILFDDYFHQATIRYITSSFWGTTDFIKETGDHENEIGTTEHFINFFFKMLQEYAFKYDIKGNKVNKSAREYFSQYEVKNNRTFQQAAASTAALIFGKSDDDVNGLMDCFSGLASRLNLKDMLTLYHNIDNGEDIEDLEGEIENLWAHLEQVNGEDTAKGFRPIGDYLTKAELIELKTCFKSLLFPLLCFAGEDNNEWDQDIAGTMAHNIPRIISNHYPEVTHSWLRSYDSFYANDTTPVTMNGSVKRAPSDVAVEITHAGGDKEIHSASEGIINISPYDLVRLVPANEADRDAGEAIYYQFTSGKASSQGVHAFSTPFLLKDMMADYADGDEFTLVATAAHYGQKLDPMTVRLKLVGDAVYSVPKEYSGGEYQYQDTPLHIGESISVNFVDLGTGDEYVFSEWKVYSYVDGTRGELISPDKYVEYFGEDFNAYDESAKICNLTGVSAQFVPVYNRVAGEVTVSFSGAADAGGLPSKVDCYETGGDAIDTDCPISWKHLEDDYIGNFSIALPEGLILLDPEYLGDHIIWENLDDYRIDNPAAFDIVESEQRVQFSVRFNTSNTNAMLMGTEPEIKGNKAVVKAYDMNLGETDSKYTFYSDSEPVRVSAPVIRDMVFLMWEDNSTELVRELQDGEEMIAYYCPVVNCIEVTLDRPLVAGEKMPSLQSVNVTVTNEWSIDNLQLEWVNQDVTVDYDTVYTALIPVDFDNLMGTNLSVEGSESQPLTGAFTFAKNAEVTVKDENGTEYNVVSYLSVDGLCIVFERTAKPKIVAFAPVNANVPNGSEAGAILDSLSDTAYAYLEDGRMVSVRLQWNGADPVSSDTPMFQTVQAYGNLQASVLDTYDVAEGASLTANVTVLEAEKTAVPVVSRSGGTYQGAQEIRLTADEGAAIYYALAVRNSDAGMPDKTGLHYQKYTGPLTLTEIGKKTYLFVYAAKDGMADSDTIWYAYQLEKPEDKPSGSSGGGGSSTYAVTPAKANNGSVTVSPKNASRGNTVTITVTPDEGYKLDKLTVTDQNGKTIPVTEKDGVYVFTMPAGKVDITPVFVKDESDSTTPPADNKNPFSDVVKSDYFYDAVLWAAKENITSGTSDTTFSPNDSCTRGQTVTFLWRAAGSPEPKTKENPFTDVKAADYYYKAVLWAYENGITLGTSDNKFSPSVSVTRGQTVTFLWRAAGSPKPKTTENPFTDIKAGDYYYDSVLWAYENGITSGTTDTAFSPDDNCLRGQIVTFLYRCNK